MSRELYFIPIIARAVKGPDPSPALRDALAAIERQGRSPEFANGYSNFQRFMAEVARRWAQDHLQAQETEAARALIVELGTHTIEGYDADQHARSLIESQAAWLEEHKRFQAEVAMSEESDSTSRFLLTRGNEVIGRLAFEKPARRQFEVGISPGHYALIAGSGLLIWEGDLSDPELIWSVAFPGRALDLAADTGETQLQPTAEETLLAGELILRVFPGLESGRLEIEVR